MVANSERMGDRVDALRRRWDNTAANSDCNNDGKWSGQIDKTLKELLDGVGELFQWMDQHRPRKREEIRQFMGTMDGRSEVLPRSAQERVVGEWLELYRYFVKCAHHGSEVSLDEFIRRFQRFESILLDLLVPQPSVEFAEIDSIIQRYEGP